GAWGTLQSETYSGDPRGAGMFRSAPDFFEQLVQPRVVLPELGAHERVEIVRAEERLGPLGEVLLGARERGVALLRPADPEHRFVRAAGAGVVEGLPDAGVIEPEDLVVIGVGELVEDHRRLLDRRLHESRGVADLDALGLL